MPARERTLVDTGAIVGLLIGKDQHHQWARRIWSELEPPLWTCEAVLSESQFLVSNFGGNPLAVLEFVKRGALRVEFRVQDESERLLQLQESYRNLPISLADACLVCMAEQLSRCRVLTTDAHFRIYRRNGRQLIPILMPEGLS